MRVGIPRETAAGEARAALLPNQVATLVAGGHDVLVVDVAVRSGGCFETTRPGVLGDTPYVEEGVRHLCVPNLASAAASTATSLLSQRLLPYVAEVAEGGIMKASARDPGLARALTPG